MRAVKQHDWKRTQLRLPQDLYKSVLDFAQQNSFSLNSAIIFLLEQKQNGSFNMENKTQSIDINMIDIKTQSMVIQLLRKKADLYDKLLDVHRGIGDGIDEQVFNDEIEKIDYCLSFIESFK